MKIKIILKRLIIVFGAMALLGLAGCYDEDKGPMQTAGEKVDTTIQKGGEAVQSGAEKTGDTIEGVSDKAGNAVKKAGEKVKDTVE